MKIEKIRCILTKEDLEDRKIKLSELVYGGEKARGLFRDMLIQASSELGFDYNNNPLMIEAVPSGREQLVLIITRVDAPEELDARFARFSTDGSGERENTYSSLADSLSGADDVLNLLRRISQARGAAGQNGAQKEERRKESRQGGSGKEAPGKGPAGGNSAPMRQMTEEEIYQYTRFYLFRSIENVISAAKGIGAGYEGENSLFKNPDDGAYYLLVRKMDTDAEQFNRICNVLSEFAMPMDYATGMDEFFREHMQVILTGRALQDLQCV